MEKNDFTTSVVTVEKVQNLKYRRSKLRIFATFIRHYDFSNSLVMLLFLVVLLFSSQLFTILGGDDDLEAIRKANARKNGSASPHYRWQFVTDGGSVKVYMFAKSTAKTDVVHIKVAGTEDSISSGASQGSFKDFGSPAANQAVTIYMTDNSGNTFPCTTCRDTFSDGYSHVKVVGFPGYDKPGFHFPSGLWLGWEDATNTPVNYNFADFCIILTGCKANFVVRDPRNPNNVWNNYPQYPNNYIITNRIISRTIEDK